MFSLDISIAVFVYPSVSSSIFRIGFGKIILVTNLRSNWKDNIHHWTIEWRIRPYVWNDSESSWPQFYQRVYNQLPHPMFIQSIA
jgi:hypothetical protein